MTKFEGKINGINYTDEKEFFDVLSKLKKTDNLCVSYRYVSVPGALDDKVEQTDNSNKFQKSIWQIDNRNFVDYTKYVRDNEYVRNITQKNDVNPDDELINKLKCASNKSEIKRDVNKRLEYFNNLISSNLFKINELKSDYKKLEEKINLINSQIKTLDDANNNYYLNKEYYTNILKSLEYSPEQFEKEEQKDNNECKCVEDNLFNDIDDSLKHSFEEVCDMVNIDKNDLAKKLNIYNLSDLVDYFLKKY